MSGRRKKVGCDICQDTGAVPTWSTDCDEAGADGARICVCTHKRLERARESEATLVKLLIAAEEYLSSLTCMESPILKKIRETLEALR